MKKKAFSILVAIGTLVLGSTSSKLFAADSATAEYLGIKVKGSSTFVMQRISDIQDNSYIQDNLDMSTFKNSATYVFSLKLIKEFENNGKIVAGFKGGGGLGSRINRNIGGEIVPFTYTRINESVNSTLNDSGDTLLKITELSYKHPLTNNGRFTACFGKLDFGSYFAGNEYAGDDTSQFITGAFTADKTIEKPSQQHVALRLNYAFDKFDISCAYFATDINNISDAHRFNIAQITYKPCKNANYRAYAWNNNDPHYVYKNNSLERGTYGFGVSLDQKIFETLGVFGRFGYKNHHTGTHVKNSPNAFSHPISNMFSVGAQIKVPRKSHKVDIIGLAIGQIRGSNDLLKAVEKNYSEYDYNENELGNECKYKNGIETQEELYYKFVVNDHVSITPIIQHIINPRGGNSIKNENMTVYGIRVSFKF